MSYDCFIGPHSSQQVLRAYTPPKRVCDICIDKYWAPKKPADAAATSSNDYKDQKRGRERGLSLTLAGESFRVDGPITAPMSVSPSTPMLEGAFFAADGEGDIARVPPPLRSSSPILSPSLLTPTLEEEGESVSAVMPMSPPLTCGTCGTCGTSGAFFDNEDDREEAAVDMNYDGDDEASKEKTVRGQCPPLQGSIATTNELPKEPEVQKVQKQQEDGEHCDSQLASVVQDEAVEEGEEPSVAAAATWAVAHPAGLVDATVFLLTLAAAALPSVMRQAASSSDGTEDGDDKREGDGLIEGQMYSFAVGLGWGVVAASVGFGFAMLLRKL